MSMMRWNVRVLMNLRSFCSGSLFSRDDMRDAPAAASAAYLPTRCRRSLRRRLRRLFAHTLVHCSQQAAACRYQAPCSNPHHLPK